ncbi:hypothetical protein [Chlorogloea sp. CCALA 695]|uniref:hypothetical protein n=1 Tax=Chlorogloea sp. CCALA 695 TaxID=2107693 RepID=UPI000D05DC66|nr:hypothetical protein [Chlorogloea sp. CCALA 695]PSB31169.1 hypothetical protein C7B70_14055 [Chlorogloea sp. CCALA 695]
MASAASNRYQSRLFSFIHNQSRFLTNRLSSAWKSLQAVTSWIAPIVFYPSLPQSAAKQNLPQLPNTPKTVDTPIKQVLLLVGDLPSQEEIVTTAPSKNLFGFLWNKFFPKVNTKLSTTANSSQLLEPTEQESSNFLVQNRPIQGIASLISNRLLVLVSPTNEILDILTSHQQQVLQARIISEVTCWRLQRLLPSKGERLPARQNWLLAPVNSIVSWVQRDKKQGKLSVFPNGAIASLDRNLAKFETDLAPIASITKAFQIQGLIWAAIDYFFKRDCAERSARGDRIPKLPEFTTNNLEDPWLEMSDLFGTEDLAKQSLVLEKPANSTSHLPQNKNVTQSDQKLNKYALNSLLRRWRQPTQKNSASVTVKTPQITKITKAQPNSLSPNLQISQKLKAVATNSHSFNLSNSVTAKSSERLEPKPDWIETPAIAMGYVKHPLEQLLEWLDLGMLWLENTLVKFWHWLQQR